MPSECIIHLEDELNVVDVYINLEHGCRGVGGGEGRGGRMSGQGGKDCLLHTDCSFSRNLGMSFIFSQLFQ